MLVGALWTFLLALGVAWLALALFILRLFDRRGPRAPFRWTRIPAMAGRSALLVALVAALESLNFYVLLWLPIELLSAHASMGWLAFSAAINAICAASAFTGLLPLLRGTLPRNTWPAVAGAVQRIGEADLEPWALPFVFIVGVLGLANYTYGLFPHLSRTFGGRKLPLVRLVLREKADAPWGQGIWASQDGARVGPVALLLESDKTVIVSAAEQFDPDAPMDSATQAVEVSNRIVSFILHSPLPNINDVLIVGGQNSAQMALDSANLFVAREPRFLVADGNLRARMTAGRIHHTVTPLLRRDGTFILVAGGEDGAQHMLATADAYQCYSAGRSTFVGFASMPPMAVARADHSAALLANNDILIAGGRNESGPLASAELFREGTTSGGTYVHVFKPAGAMTAPRARHSATALQDRRGPHAGEVLIAGGSGAGDVALDTAELYDPVAGVFTSTGRMTTAREGHTATLLNDGLVLLAGGVAPSGILNTAEIYDPGAGSFRPTGSMSTVRAFHTATLSNDGRVVMIGGRNTAGALNSSEIYDPRTGTFTPAGSMTRAREEHTATLLDDGTVLVAGGRDGRASLTSAEFFDDWTQTFAAISDMPVAVHAARATLLRPGTRR